jgi:tellurite resistance protein
VTLHVFSSLIRRFGSDWLGYSGKGKAENKVGQMTNAETGKAPFGSRVPPAIFPPILGLFALANGWRVAVGGAGQTPWLGQIVATIAGLMLVVGLAAYGRKLLRRPSVVLEDLTVLPGRAGIAAMILSSYLLAGVLVPIMPEAAHIVLWVGVGAHVMLVVAMIVILFRSAPEARRVTPIFHLHFVGFIVTPQAAVPLGYIGFSTVVFWVSLVLAVLIWLASAYQARTDSFPGPQRPLLAIHLAPLALLGSVALLLGYETIALAAGLLLIAALALLFVRGRSMLEAGFTPMWGALTFPLASAATLLMMLGYAEGSWAFSIAGLITLILVSGLNPYIAMRVWQAWGNGKLAQQTGAARA